MASPAGYSLDQLLRWCHDDRLIDNYVKHDRSVVIQVNGSQRELSLSDAEAYLKEIFTSTVRPSFNGSDLRTNRA